MDDLGKDDWGDEIGQCDHNGWEVQYQEVLPKNHLVNFLERSQKALVSLSGVATVKT